jgi:hypothetical protein
MILFIHPKVQRESERKMLKSGDRINNGTLGCFCKDETGKIYGLTNAHIIFSGTATVNSPFVNMVSGKYNPDITIELKDANLLDFKNIFEERPNPESIDAAIFPISENLEIEIKSQPTKVLPVSEFIDNMKVTKLGIASGETIGGLEKNPIKDKIDYFDCFVNSKKPKWGISSLLSWDIYKIKLDCYNIHPLIPSHSFSQGGDSGSLVTTIRDGVNYAVGLIFAANEYGPRSIMAPLEPLLKKYNLSLDLTS